jgi:hypothetical protein
MLNPLTFRATGVAIQALDFGYAVDIVLGIIVVERVSFLLLGLQKKDVGKVKHQPISRVTYVTEVLSPSTFCREVKVLSFLPDSDTEGNLPYLLQEISSHLSSGYICWHCTPNL